MKPKEEPNTVKKEVKTVNGKSAELNDTELKQVSGGGIGSGGGGGGGGNGGGSGAAMSDSVLLAESQALIDANKEAYRELAK